MLAVVTGAAGFIGSHLCERLLSEGYRVIGVDNLVTGSERNISAVANDTRFDFVESDVAQPPRVEQPVDVVYHMASPASPKDYQRHPVATLRAGSIGTLNYLELARRHQAVFVLASTSEVYGDPLEHPQRETYFGNVNPVGPRSMYDESKRFAEAATMTFHRSFGLSVRIARIFNTYGPRMRPDDGRVVPSFICQAIRGEPLTIYGDGSQTRSFCFVDDLVEALVRLPRVGYNGPVNLGNPKERTILELAELISGMIDPQIRIVRKSLPQDDPRKRRPDITLARKLLDWEPRVSLEEGLRRTIPYFRSILGVQD